MARGPRRTTPDHLSIDERYERAKSRTATLVGFVSSIIELQASNEILLYSDRIRSQVPTSAGAHAFNALQRSMHLYALVRLMALWDRYGEDRISIPTVTAYLAHTDVRARAIDAARERWLHAPAPDFDANDDFFTEQMHLDWWANYRQERATRDADSAERGIDFALRKGADVEKHSLVQALRNYRDNFIAHNLDASSALPVSPAPAPVRYGDEKRLLRATISIVDQLHISLNGTSYVWSSSREIAQTNARDLWFRCKFDFESPLPDEPVE